VKKSVLPLLALLTSLAGCSGVNETTFPSDLSLLSIRDGWAPLTADAIEGRIVVLTFFSVPSVPCLGCDIAIREIDQVYRTYATDESVKVLIISTGSELGTGPDPRYVMVPYLNQHDVRAPAYWDRRAQLARRFDFRAPNYSSTFGRGRLAPVDRILTVVIGSDGRVLHRQHGVSQTAPRVIRAIETARARGA
jgi:hypothetical protein